MSDSLNFSDTIKPKSDQTNADDFLLGPVTFTITGVKRGNDEQPISIHLSNGFQPFKPCKSMRRVLITAWGEDGKKWVGRSLTLYRDPKVKFGGEVVGGIRISHMSNIGQILNIALTTTRGKRSPYVVNMLNPDAASQPHIQQYPDDKFSIALPEMRKRYHDGTMTIEQIAAQCEKTGRLTAVQREKIMEKAQSEGPQQAVDF